MRISTIKSQKENELKNKEDVMRSSDGYTL